MVVRLFSLLLALFVTVLPLRLTAVACAVVAGDAEQSSEDDDAKTESESEREGQGAPSRHNPFSHPGRGSVRLPFSGHGQAIAGISFGRNLSVPPVPLSKRQI